MEIVQDKLGSIFGVSKGNGPKIMFAGHMDEVGFIVTSVTDDGYIKFSQVGGIDDRILLTQKVLIGDNKIKGIIGRKFFSFI